MRLGEYDYRLIISDKDRDRLAFLHHTFLEKRPTAEIDAQSCSMQASWEADALIIAAPREEWCEISGHVKEVASCKTVVAITDRHDYRKAAAELAMLFPQSAIIIARPTTHGNEEAYELLRHAGLSPVAETQKELSIYP